MSYFLKPTYDLYSSTAKKNKSTIFNYKLIRFYVLLFSTFFINSIGSKEVQLMLGTRLTNANLIISFKSNDSNGIK